MTAQRWQKKKNHVAHSDDWLMTYADMITLLLCFFAIVIITSIPKRQAPPPVLLQSMPVPSLLPAPEKDAQPNMTVFAGDLPFSDTGPEEDAKPVETAPVEASVAPPETPPAPEAASASLAEIADTLKTQGPADLQQQGDRLTTLEVNSAAFFGSGSATLSASGMEILRGVAVNLKGDQFRDYQITVEGHTDDTPIHTLQFPSNWELSTARASAVVHFFLQQGVPAVRLRAAGYADSFPKEPNRDAAGKPIPAHQAENRRVVIKLEKIEKSGIDIPLPSRSDN